MSKQSAGISALSRGRGREDRAAPPQERVPQPRRRWRTRVLLPAAIVASTLGLTGFSARDLLRPAVPVDVVPVMIKTNAEAATGTVVVQAPGWVEADPFPVAVTALAGGVVEQVLVLEGERVEKDQVVARLIDNDLRIARDGAAAVLAEREAALLAARARLDEARRNWDHPIELTRALQTAEARLQEQRAILERWPAELAKEKAHAVYLEAEYKRLEPLVGRGQATKIEVIRAQQALKTQRAQIEVTRLREPMLRARVAKLEAEVKAARENFERRIADTRALEEAKAAVARAEAEVASARAALEDAALQLDRMKVRAPVSGVVMNRLVEPGSKVLLQMDDPRSAQIVRLYDPERLQVRVDVPLVDAAKVGVGQDADVVVDVLPDRVFDGRVTRMVHESDVQKNTLQVKVAIHDPTSELKPEMLARARFFAMGRADGESETQKTTEQVFVPESAVKTQDGSSFVWLADQIDDVARRRVVSLGRVKEGDWVAVTDGLRAGDRVIVGASSDLEQGRRIRMRER